MLLSRTFLARTFLAGAVLALSACGSSEDGSGRTSEDGRGEIAATGMFNGQETHGDGVGTVQDHADANESGIYPDHGDDRGDGMPQASNAASGEGAGNGM